jgi:large repetitive protein
VTRVADGLGHALSDSGRYASCFTRIGQVGVVLKDLETGQSVTLPTTDFAPGLPTNNGTLVVQVGTELVELNFASPVVTLDTVAGDNVVNGAEKSAPVTLSGTSDQVGGLVELFSSGVRVATATVAMDGSWTTTADFSLIPDGARSLSARVEKLGKAGNASTSLLVDSQAFLTIGGNGDDIVNATESLIH